MSGREICAVRAVLALLLAGARVAHVVAFAKDMMRHYAFRQGHRACCALHATRPGHGGTPSVITDPGSLCSAERWRAPHRFAPPAGGSSAHIREQMRGQARMLVDRTRL